MDLEKEALALPDKIKERKANVKKAAEQRRLEDSQKIRSLNSSNDGGANPLEIFPKEVWDAVFTFLRTPEDLENARKTCTLFEDLLDQRRLEDILLPKVLRLKDFRKHVWNQKPPLQIAYANEDESRTEDELLHTESVSDSHLHVNLRRLSKTLRNKVDLNMDQLLELDSNFQFDLDGRSYCFRKVVGLDFSPLLYHLHDIGGNIPLGRKQPFYSFMENADPSLTPIPAKRFVGKALRLYFVGPMDYPQHMKDVTKFMKLLGGQILHFQPHIRISPLVRPFGLTTIQAYQYLQEWCLKMPNLKYLYLMLETPLRTIRLEDLKSAIRRSPFPHLPELKRFSFELHLGSHFEFEVDAAIIEANQHLKELVVEYFNYPEKLQRILPPVKALNLEKISFSALGPISGFEQFFNPNWPLSRIHLKLEPNSEGDEPVLNVLGPFMVLQYFKETLKHVALELVMSWWWIEETLELPHVTHFSLRFNVDERDFDENERSVYGSVLQVAFNSIDFLIPMEKLEELKWINMVKGDRPHERTVKEKELIKFEGGQFDLYSEESNIWDVFPSLREATIHANKLSTKKIYERKYRQMKKA